MIEVVHVYRDALFEAFPPAELPEGYVGPTVYPLMGGDGDGDGDNSEGGEGAIAATADGDGDTVRNASTESDAVNATNAVNAADTVNAAETITPADTATPIIPTPTDTPTTTPLPQHELDEQLTRLCLLVAVSSLSHAVPQRRLALRTPPPSLQLPLQVPRRPRARRPSASQRVLYRRPLSPTQTAPTSSGPAGHASRDPPSAVPSRCSNTSPRRSSWS